MVRKKTPTKITHNYITKDWNLGYCGNLNYTISKLTDIRNSIPVDAEEIYTAVRASYHRDYYDDIDTNIEVTVTYWIKKTDEELELERELRERRSISAKAAAAKRQEKKDAKDREEYERLKAKFEKT